MTQGCFGKVQETIQEAGPWRRRRRRRRRWWWWWLGWRISIKLQGRDVCSEYHGPWSAQTSSTGGIILRHWIILAVRGKTCQTQTTECTSRAFVKLQNSHNLHGEEEDQQPVPLQSKFKVRKMKNGCEDSAKVIWCYDVCWRLVLHRLICLTSRTWSRSRQCLSDFTMIFSKCWATSTATLWALMVHLGFVWTDPVGGSQQRRWVQQGCPGAACPSSCTSSSCASKR